MNERNVDALEDLLNCNVLYKYTQHLSSRRELAVYLASSGVLATATLTDADWSQMSDAVRLWRSWNDDLALAKLERLARGD